VDRILSSFLPFGRNGGAERFLSGFLLSAV
jgi:hypothetical protein